MKITRKDWISLAAVLLIVVGIFWLWRDVIAQRAPDPTIRQSPPPGMPTLEEEFTPHPPVIHHRPAKPTALDLSNEPKEDLQPPEE